MEKVLDIKGECKDSGADFHAELRRHHISTNLGRAMQRRFGAQAYDSGQPGAQLLEGLVSFASMMSVG